MDAPVITVTRSTPGGYDSNRNPITSTSSTSTLGAGCAVAPVSALEAPPPVDGVVITHTLFCPTSSGVASGDVRRNDLVTWGGSTFRVIEVPEVWEHPNGSPVGGLAASLKRTEGPS